MSDQPNQEMHIDTDPFLMFAELGSYFPPEMDALFKQASKREIEKHLSSFVLTRDMMARAALSAEFGNAPYTHRRFHFEYVPQPVKEKTDGLRDMLNRRDWGAVCSTLDQAFKQRKLISAHLFENAQGWHVFYCDQRDIADSDENHWVGGSHWHFVNHLFGNNVTKEQVWAGLQGKDRNFTGIHVKYDDGRKGEDDAHSGESKG